MISLFDQIARWPRAMQILVILCCCVSLDLALLTLLWLVITSPPAGAGAIMSIMSTIQFFLSRRRRPTGRQKPRLPKPP